MYRIVIIDDHRVFADTLASALTATGDFEVVGVANTAQDGSAAVESSQPDLVLLDVDLPDAPGTELIPGFRQHSPQTRIVVLTGGTDAGQFSRAVNDGVDAFLMKSASLEEICAAATSVMSGATVIPRDVVDRLVAAGSVDAAEAGLAPREIDVLRLLSEGCDHKAIAVALDISWHTARSYVKNLLRKLDAHSQLEAVAIARRRGLLEDGSR